ncbi:LuxR family transcriptional regulator [Methylobacterium sp. Leaf469]|uniref:substrate-binding domain-containing protein n=1 Tax=unclassified Methylobacterium TaxID=2615210 RepID=UPI00070174D1|nr:MULTISPECIES: helix-turn-helix transcriptional regulator [unclassified Methylobacterium]KQP72097.1 LuxR family transcriptional regulator [Methylobacterium sp. Leaf112]KQU05622.1 LuxR family transcriptional regulator [Methylobacterium sp. Leaf469]
MTQDADGQPLSIALGIGGTIRIGEQHLGVAETLAIVEAIARTGSVQGIATELGLSYRAAWERLRTLESALGHQIVQKTRGHGSTLTETGVALHDALAEAAAALAGPLAREGRSVQARLAGLLGDAAPTLTLVASHDLLLMTVLADWPGIAVVVAGSADAVARLAEGRADAAGFHCGPGGLALAGPAFADLGDTPGIRVRPLFEREQGVMLAAGNPLGIQGFADLARLRARTINRQRGSGTRVWFDRLLAEHGIEPSDIQGYATEEFTHQAVAAVIASGAADAGLGARAAAERFGLAFLSLGWECYYLACSASLPDALLDRVAEAVAEGADRTVGYRRAKGD